MSEQRIGHQNLHRLQTHLSERDTAILRSVAQHQFLTTNQITRLHFYTHHSAQAATRACVRVLARLAKWRIVRRLEQRDIGGQRAGSTSFIWTLDVAGTRLTTNPATARQRRTSTPSTMFLGHTLAVAETRLVFEETARAGHFTLSQIETEPTSWRPLLNAHGIPTHLKPDLTAITDTETAQDHWFIEVDKATESLRRLAEQCALYMIHRRSGKEQNLRGIYPRVLWVVPTNSRAGQLRQLITEDPSLDTNLFTVITPDELVATITTDTPLTRDPGG